jgi:hypothetical protein
MTSEDSILAAHLFFSPFLFSIGRQHGLARDALIYVLQIHHVVMVFVPFADPDGLMHIQRRALRRINGGCRSGIMLAEQRAPAHGRYRLSGRFGTKCLSPLPPPSWIVRKRPWTKMCGEMLIRYQPPLHMAAATTPLHLVASR